jgi:hypothetical protein
LVESSRFLAQRIGNHEKRVKFGGDFQQEDERRRIEEIVVERMNVEVMIDRLERCRAGSDRLG